MYHKTTFIDEIE